MKKHSTGMEQLFDDFVFIASRKLTEGSKYVQTMAEMFTRFVLNTKGGYDTPEDIHLAFSKFFTVKNLEPENRCFPVLIKIRLLLYPGFGGIVHRLFRLRREQTHKVLRSCRHEQF